MTEAAERADRGPFAAARRAMVGFALALQFLTAAPALLRREASAVEVGRSMVFFPLIGLGVGTALAGLDAALGLVFPDPLRSALVVAATLLATRGLHVDGLADTCDGLFGGWTPERRLEIMRDSRVGSFGVIAVAVDVALRVAALASLPTDLRAPAIVGATVLGRWSLVYATGAFPYARPSGMGAAFKAALTPRRVVAASLLAVLCLAAAISLFGLPSPLALRIGGSLGGGLGLGLAALVIANLFARYVLTKIPGLTGDTYGATNELVELTVLLLLNVRV